MAEQSNAELIAEAETLVRHSSVSVPEHAVMINALVAELKLSEDARRERDHYKALVEQYIELVERARKLSSYQAGDSRENSWLAIPKDELDDVLSEAPTLASRDSVSAEHACDSLEGLS